MKLVPIKQDPECPMTFHCMRTWQNTSFRNQRVLLMRHGRGVIQHLRQLESGRLKEPGLPPTGERGNDFQVIG